MTDLPTYGGPSPWGRIQHLAMLAPGIWQLSTASHGGIWLSPDRLAHVRPEWRAYAAEWSHGWGSQWFEEDCAALAVLATFSELAPLFSITPAQAAQQLALFMTPRKVAQ